jgi:hypothetical protein
MTSTWPRQNTAETFTAGLNNEKGARRKHPWSAPRTSSAPTCNSRAFLGGVDSRVNTRCTSTPPWSVALARLSAASRRSRWRPQVAVPGRHLRSGPRGSGARPTVVPGRRVRPVLVGVPVLQQPRPPLAGERLPGPDGVLGRSRAAGARTDRVAFLHGPRMPLRQQQSRPMHVPLRWLGPLG